MPKAYRVTKRAVRFNMESSPREVYSVAPVTYGTLTTDDVANQIAAESSATPGDVKNVLDRYAHYVVENLKKGYAVQLLGFGVLNIRFLKGKTVESADKANASLIKGLIPSFSPSFTMVNGSRKYDLLPDKIQLVKYSGSLPSGSDPSSGSTGEPADPSEEPTDPIV